MAVTHDLLSGMPFIPLKKRTHPLWNSILPEPGQPSAQLSKLIRLTTCKKTVSRWYRTVYIRWLVASYDTHKGKRWLNSDLPKPQGANRQLNVLPTHISDINYEIADSTVSCFANDTRMLLGIKDEEDAKMLQNDLHRLYKWADTNNMTFNANKFELLPYGNHHMMIQTSTTKNKSEI